LSDLRASVEDFTSPLRAPYDLIIPEGKMLSHLSETQSLQREIRNQLRFLIGNLNSRDAGPNFTLSLKIEVLNVFKREDFNEVTFKANLLVGWPKNETAPQELFAWVPQRGDQEGIQQFYTKYKAKCGGHEEIESFFFYYNPFISGCDVQTQGAEGVSAIKLQLKPRPMQSDEKFPEYQKIWEDGRLTATTVFGNTISEDSLMGEDLFTQLKTKHGDPVSYALDKNEKFQNIKAEFKVANGVLDINIIDILDGNAESEGDDPAFVKVYNERSSISDYVSYNGHSGLGDNVKAISKLGNFVAKKYQIFNFHGCDTFSYIHPALFDNHAKANPGTPASKYLDVVSTVNVGAFGVMAPYNFEFIEALLGKTESFSTLLSRMPVGSPAVIGEEDNFWPKPFEE
jgi:hypothetical protein